MIQKTLSAVLICVLCFLLFVGCTTQTQNETPEAVLENIDFSGFDSEKLVSLDTVVMTELEKQGVKDEWKNHSEEDPFIFWEE